MSNQLMKSSLNNRRIIVWLLGLLVMYFFVFHNLTRFPSPWFDEGSHLHVPKTIVTYGVYADISSEGFRYYGPTIGVGPTVLLPVAGVFKLFGIGLLQARIVMSVYLLAAIYVSYYFVEHLAGKWVSLAAISLMLSSRSVLFLEYGRQLLGEVPGYFFLLLALYLWFTKWNVNNWKRLSLIGLFLGFAMITKYQYLLFLAPALFLSWLLDIFYYKQSTHRNFLIPGIIAAGSFGIWQLITLQYFGPSTALENLALLRASAEGAAFNFNITQLAANAGMLTSRAVYLGALLPALIYGFIVSFRRTSDGQKWSVIFLLVVLNLFWYTVASIGWIRYAFLGLALSSIFIARFLWEIIGDSEKTWNAEFFRSLFNFRNATGAAAALWLLAIITIPLAKNMIDIAFPSPSYAQQMSAYINDNIPMDVTIETWEPEMGFLTDHNYHYPPNNLLAVAVKQIYSNGAPVRENYDFVQSVLPEYLLVGEFSKWTQIYPLEELMDEYELLSTYGTYDLYLKMNR